MESTGDTGSLITKHPLQSKEDFEPLIERLTPIVRIFREKLPNQSNVQLFLLYLIRHTPSGHWAKLIRPQDMGYLQKDWWPDQFYADNKEAIEVAVEKGREKPSDTTMWPYIYKVIDHFETSDNEKLVSLDPPAKRWADMKHGGFEWKGDSIDNYYPMVVLLKVKVPGRNPCIAVISVSYDSQEPCAGYCLRELKQFLEEISKHLHIPITYVEYTLEDADWDDWNGFRASVGKLNGNLHHAPCGGSGVAAPWIVKSQQLITEFRQIGNLACAAIDRQGYEGNVMEYFGQPENKPSVRELLQWDNGEGYNDTLDGITIPVGGKSLTSLVARKNFWGTSLSEGEINQDYWWFNPFALRKFAAAAESAYKQLKDEEKDETEALKGTFAVFLKEVDNDVSKGMWFFVEEPGLNKATKSAIKVEEKYGEIKLSGGMATVVAVVRQLGASSIYVIDKEQILKYKIPAHLSDIKNGGIYPSSTKPLDLPKEFNNKRGIAIFLKAENRSDVTPKTWKIADPKSQE